MEGSTNMRVSGLKSLGFRVSASDLVFWLGLVKFLFWVLGFGYGSLTTGFWLRHPCQLLAISDRRRSISDLGQERHLDPQQGLGLTFPTGPRIGIQENNQKLVVLQSGPRLPNLFR